VHELVAVAGDLLVSAVLAVQRDGVGEKTPAQLRLLQVGGSLGRILLPETRRGSALREGSDARSGDSGRLGPNDLRIAVFRQNIELVLAVPRVNQEVEATVGVLELREKNRLPISIPASNH